ncbi:glycosyltransferase 87 family protein [Nakamurella sp.]|uniref:glycosyltransferase 87 family protein n=1 Tax=Nakamurella sp. TaxID=1869182 RepID=UPI003B3AC936
MTTPIRSDAHTPRARVPAIAVLAVVAVLAGAAIAARLLFVDEVNSDYQVFLSPWYDALAAGGGLRAIGQEIGNYNPPYLYLLAVATYLPVPKIVAIKLVSIVFDLVLAAFAGLIVRGRFGAWPGVAAFGAVLFAPTVLVNSGYWGQCDSVYAAFCLGSLFFLLRGRSWWACLFFGLALSFKLQAIFFLPVLLIVLVVNRRRLLALLAVPATFLAMLLPAALAGRPWSSLLAVYPAQVTDGGTGAGRGSGFGGGFGAGGGSTAGGSGLGAWTKNGPTMFQWVGGSVAWLVLGLVIAAILLVGLAVVAWRHRPLGEAQIVVLAAAVVLAVPFFLPQMHERYFYLADVLTIVAAFYVRRFWPVAVAVSASSLLSYAPFLWRSTPVALPLVSFLEFLAVIATVVVAVHVLTTPDSRWIRGAGVARSRWSPNADRRSDADPAPSGDGPGEERPAPGIAPMGRPDAPVSPSSDRPAGCPPSLA